MHDMTTLHDRLKQRIERDGRRPETDTLPVDQARRERSLRTSHLPAARKPPIVWTPANGRYVPELSAAIDDDPNLCDGARRCARKIAEYAYRHHREDRTPKLTVTYLAQAMRRCRRTVQRYLRQLERAGYITVEVILSARSGLCLGLAVTLREDCFAKHHAQKWPFRAGGSGVTRLSFNQRYRYIRRPIPLQSWALRCMSGIWAARLKALPPLVPLPAPSP